MLTYSGNARNNVSLGFSVRKWNVETLLYRNFRATWIYIYIYRSTASLTIGSQFACAHVNVNKVAERDLANWIHYFPCSHSLLRFSIILFYLFYPYNRSQED